MRAALRLLTWSLVALLYVPIALIFFGSLSGDPYGIDLGSPTLRWYRALASDREALTAFVNSVSVATVSAVASVALAFLAAYSVGTRRATLLDAISYPPIVIPEIAEAVALLLLFHAVGAELGWFTVFIGHTAFNLAFAYVTLRASGVRFNSMEGAARTLGAGRLSVIRHIVIPLAMPGIVIAFAITFLLSFTNFIKTLFTTGPGFYTLPLLIWNRARRPGIDELTYPNALNALAVPLVMVALSVAAVYTIYFVVMKRER